jgi:hypothetical protein
VEAAGDTLCFACSQQQESDQSVEALRANGIPVTYLVLEDEDHDFVKPENAKRFTALTETFLARTLGGKLLPAAARGGPRTAPPRERLTRAFRITYDAEQYIQQYIMRRKTLYYQRLVRSRGSLCNDERMRRRRELVV